MRRSQNITKECLTWTTRKETQVSHDILRKICRNCLVLTTVCLGLLGCGYDSMALDDCNELFTVEVGPSSGDQANKQDEPVCLFM